MHAVTTAKGFVDHVELDVVLAERLFGWPRLVKILARNGRMLECGKATSVGESCRIEGSSEHPCARKCDSDSFSPRSGGTCRHFRQWHPGSARRAGGRSRPPSTAGANT
jgi:hypothetical protein